MKETGVINRSIPVIFAILRESTLDPTPCFILKSKEKSFLQIHLYVDIMIMTADISKELIPYIQEYVDNNYKPCVYLCFFIYRLILILFL